MLYSVDLNMKKTVAYQLRAGLGAVRPPCVCLASTSPMATHIPGRMMVRMHAMLGASSHSRISMDLFSFRTIFSISQANVVANMMSYWLLFSYTGCPKLLYNLQGWSRSTACGRALLQPQSFPSFARERTGGSHTYICQNDTGSQLGMCHAKSIAMLFALDLCNESKKVSMLHLFTTLDTTLRDLRRYTWIRRPACP